MLYVMAYHRLLSRLANDLLKGKFKLSYRYLADFPVVPSVSGGRLDATSRYHASLVPRERSIICVIWRRNFYIMSESEYCVSS
jgi:hypothetical protein